MLLVIWYKILQRLKMFSQTMQNPEMNVSVIVELYDSVIEFTSECRENIDLYEQEARTLSDVLQYKKQMRRSVKRK